MTFKRATVTIIAAVFIASVSFVAGTVLGQQLAVGSIKSELVWYNQATLVQAIDDMKKGDILSAEEKIMYVHAELTKMGKKR